MFVKKTYKHTSISIIPIIKKIDISNKGIVEVIIIIPPIFYSPIFKLGIAFNFKSALSLFI